MNLLKRVSQASMLLVLAFVLLFTASTNAAASENPWGVKFNERSGLYVEYQGVPVIWRSTLYVVKPGWLGTLFGEHTEKYEIAENTVNGLPEVKVKGESETFVGNWTIKVVSDKTVKIDFNGRLKKDVPCQAEFNLGCFNANLIANKSYKGVKRDGSKFRGKVAVYPTKRGMWAANIMPSFKKFEFDSTLGKFKVDVTSPLSSVFFDARNSASGWAATVPQFWCGYSVDQKAMKPKNFKWSMKLSIEPGRSQKAGVYKDANATATLTAAKIAKGYEQTGKLIVPKPKTMKVAGSHTVLGNEVFCSVKRPAGEERLDRAVVRTINKFDGIKMSKVRAAESNDGVVVIKIASQKLEDAFKVAKPSGKWFANDEGYMLTAEDDTVTIVSSTAKGAFYGLQTLKQLLRIDVDGLELPTIKVTDWPDMQFRGNLFFPSKPGYEMNRRFIERVIAPMKFNTLIMEVDKMQWDTNPKLAFPFSISKAQLRELIKLARENYLEPVPLVNFPGHTGWLYNNDQNKDVCEDWEAKYTMCTKNPKSYELVFKFYDELIELFEPKTFHMGHDEILTPGKMPNPDCPYCGDMTKDDVGELFMNFMNKCSDYLNAKGIRTMVWSDMMLFKGESPDACNAISQKQADYCRANLPKDVIVGDWHYDAKDDYKSQKIFKKAGADVVGCVWYNPDNIYNMSKMVKKTGNIGQLQTMWCGWAPTDQTIKEAFTQFEANILTAEYSWSDRKEAPTKLPYTQGDMFNKLYSPPVVEIASGKLIDLSSVGNVSRSRWPLAGTGWNLNVLPKGLVNFKGYNFQINKSKLVVLGNSQASPKGAYQSLILDMGNVTAKEIVLLNTGSSNVMPNTKIAAMIVNYVDGSKAVLDLVSNVNTSGLIAGKQSTTLNAGWIGLAKKGNRMAFFLTNWKNEQPEKKIKSIEFKPETKQAGWILAGMTLVD